jgi:hypothetical protein
MKPTTKFLLSVKTTLLILLSPSSAQNPEGVAPSTSPAPQSEVRVEMHRIELPEIAGSVNVPSNWSIVTFFEAKQAVENTVFVSEEAKNVALQAAQSIGSQSFKTTKEVEPYAGLNYSFSIAWSPLSESVNSVPLEARSEVSKRMIDNQLLPKIKSLSRDLTILEQPTPIDNKGSGAWVTYKEKVIKKDKTEDAEIEGFLITRLYLLIKSNYFIIVTLSFPEYDDQKVANVNKDILGEMLKSFQIQGK